MGGALNGLAKADKAAISRAFASARNTFLSMRVIGVRFEMQAVRRGRSLRSLFWSGRRDPRRGRAPRRLDLAGRRDPAPEELEYGLQGVMVRTSPALTPAAVCWRLVPLTRTRPAATSFAASERDFTIRAKNVLSMRWLPGCAVKSRRYLRSWSRSAASLANGESGSTRTGRSSRGLP